MSTTHHPITPEEVMAWADGELPVEKAESVSEHVALCSDCREILLRIESSRRALSAWTMEEISAESVHRMKSIMDAKFGEQSNAKPKLFLHGSWVRTTAVVGAIVCSAILIFAITVPNLLRSRMAANEASAVGSLRTLNTAAATYLETYGHYPPSLASFGPPSSGEISEFAAGLIDSVLASGTKSGYRFIYRSTRGVASRRAYEVSAFPLNQAETGRRHFSTDQTGVIRTDTGESLGGSDEHGVQERGQTTEHRSELDGGPMVARAAELKVIVSSLDDARGGMDRILKLHHGFTGQLSVSAENGSARFVDASLRVPREELDACVNELKSLGRVRTESQTGEEISQQHLDLVARLKNARRTETKIDEIIQKKTGNVKDILLAETEATRVREGIEKMEAERDTMEKRVVYSVIAVTLSEEFQEELRSTSATTSTRLHNALVSGLRDGSETAVGLVAWLISVIPTLLVWLIVLSLPLRWGWRRWRMLTNGV